MFRNKYLDYAELTAQLAAWQRAHPDFVRVTSIGKSHEGRDIPLVTIGRNPDEHRPAIWVDGNMHATELCGSSVALAIAMSNPAAMPWPLASPIVTASRPSGSGTKA
jgi:murein tripeptide amidase MpaA